MREIGLGLIINNAEVARVDGTSGKELGMNMIIEFKRQDRNHVFENSLTTAYEKLFKIAQEKYPNQDYRIILDVKKSKRIYLKKLKNK